MGNKKKRSLKYFLGVLALTLFGVGVPGPRFPVWAQEEEQEKETVVYESPVFTDGGETFLPKEHLERDGKEYCLDSTKIQSAVKEGTKTYASATVPYVLEGRQEPPEKAVVTLIDDATGEEYEREVPRLEVVEKGTFWDNEFSFSVTVSEYDSDGFLLGETEVPADSDLGLYGEEFLRYLELPEDCYKVETVEWDGECYEQDGVLCRNAVASGVKLMRNVEVKYGGQVRTPEVHGRRYVGIYEEITVEPEEEETKEEPGGEEQEPIHETKDDAHEPSQEAGFIQKVLYWMKNHLIVVTLGAGFFLVFFLAGMLLWLLHRENKRKSRVP